MNNIETWKNEMAANEDQPDETVKNKQPRNEVWMILSPVGLWLAYSRCFSRFASLYLPYQVKPNRMIAGSR